MIILVLVLYIYLCGVFVISDLRIFLYQLEDDLVVLKKDCIVFKVLQKSGEQNGIFNDRGNYLLVCK